MAEKLLEDLIPEEPPERKVPEPPKPAAVQATPLVATAVKPETKTVGPPPIPGPLAEKVPQKEEKRPVEEKPVEAKPADVKPAKDDFSEIVERIHTLGTELVQIRNEIKTVREKYTAKTKEMEGLQEKLKGLLGQVG